jgi:hypothetical protein
MRADGERFLDTLAADCSNWQRIRALLGGVRWRNRFHALPGARSLKSKYGEELGPPSVLNAFVGTRLAHCPVALIAAVPVWLGSGATAEVGGLDRLDIDCVVLAHQLARFLMMEVAPLVGDVLMRLGQEQYRLTTALAPLLAATRRWRMRR